MAIAFVNAGASATGTTSVSPAQPAGTSSTDVLVAFIIDHATSGSSTAPTNWTNAGSAAGSAGRFQVFWAYKSALTGTSWTFSGLTTRAQGVIVGFSGVDQTTAMDVSPSARINASGTTGSTAITPTTANNVIVAAFASLSNGATWSAEAVATNPASLAEVFDAANGGFCSLAVAWGAQTTAGTTGASSATMSTNAANAGIVAALRPAATVTLTGAAVAGSPGALTESGAGTVTATGAGITSAAGIVVTGGPAYYRTITVDHTKVPSNQTSFPVLVSGVYSYLATVANGGLVQNANGYDIGFYTDSTLSTKLNWEVETYDGVTGTIVAWVNVPSLSSSADTVFYLGYGNAAITTDQSNKTGVWDANYKAVQHLANGVTLSLTDSTSNANNGSNSGATAASGQIDGAAAFNGSSNSISLPSNSTLDLSTAATVSAWVNPSALQDGNVVNRNVSGSETWELRLDRGGNGAFNWIVVIGTSLVPAVSSTTVSSKLNTWTYVVGTFDNSNGNVIQYINGLVDGTNNTGGGTIHSNSGAPVGIGNDVTNGGNFFAGAIDEVRISNSPRTADWILAEYRNQSSPSTFYSVGSQVPPSGGSSVTLTGAAATSSAGAVTNSGAGAVTLVGASVALTAGIVVAAVAASVTLSGALVTGSAGPVAASGASAKTITGAASTGTAGSVTANANGSVTLTGASSPSGAGTLTLNADGTSTLVGASMSGTAGTITESGAASASLTGAAITSSAGTVAASSGSSASVTLVSSAITSSPGTLTAVGDGAAGLGGAATTGSAGTVTASAGSSASVNITGAATAGSAGTVSAAGNGDVTLPGGSITGTAGTVSGAGATSIVLVGAQATPSPGAVTAMGEATTSLTGAAAVGTPGTVVAESGSGSVDLAGSAITATAGVVTPSASGIATLTGARLGAGSGAGTFMFIG